MIVTFLKLLIAHLLADFFLQPDKWVVSKKEKAWKTSYFWYHILVVGLLTWLVLFSFNLWYIALGIALLHLLIDLAKIYLWKDNFLGFTVDQFCHILVLLIACIIIHNDVNLLKWFSLLENRNVLLITTGYLIVTSPCGFLIGKATQKWRNQLTSDSKTRDSLEDAGIWIGILERVLVLTFVLANMFQAIGFLIAAKSILRFSDKTENNPRKQTEYVLIGTLLSFTLALFIGLLINYFKHAA